MEEGKIESRDIQAALSKALSSLTLVARRCVKRADNYEIDVLLASLPSVPSSVTSGAKRYRVRRDEHDARFFIYSPLVSDQRRKST